jgi:hypothetical protein
MSDEIKIGPDTFTPARQTFKQLLELSPLQDKVDALRDEVIGLRGQLDHAEAAMFALADAEGDYDLARLDELKRKRRELRERTNAAAVEHFKSRVDLIAVRLVPRPDVDFLLEHLDAEDLDRVVEELNRPTKPPSDQGSGTP